MYAIYMLRTSCQDQQEKPLWIPLIPYSSSLQCTIIGGIMTKFDILSEDDEETKTLDLTSSTRIRSMLSLPDGRDLKSCMKVTTIEDSLSNTRAANGSRGNHSVAFRDIEIRSYEMILGCNPAVSKGAPVTIDWKPFNTTICSVDYYEDVREETIRNYHEMKMPAPVRFDLLTRTTSTKDIVRCTKQVNDIKRQRLETSSTLYKAKAHEKLEKFSRGFKNLITNKKKKEKEYLQSAQVLLEA
jgi:hypothetical protein